MGFASAVLAGVILDGLIGWIHPVTALLAGVVAGWLAGSQWVGIKAGIAAGLVGGALASAVLVAGGLAVAGPLGAVAGGLASLALWWVFLMMALLNGVGGFLGGALSGLARRARLSA